MELLTTRLRLRPMSLSDVAQAHALATSPGVARPAGYPTPKKLNATRLRVARSVAEWRKRTPSRLSFTILRRDDNAWIGLINLNWPHAGVGELGYSLHPRHWGNGYASEAARRVVDLAFDTLGAHRVQATCWVRNRRSAAVLRRAGLKKEGLLRGYLKRGQVVRDEFMFGLARRER
ncbi:MAG: GNAT family N-acetyltransferase [Elusimicrobia bacterium]|nr:GNAT family N-acetyltransferase [Elusimicrobiota bacterium]